MFKNFPENSDVKDTEFKFKPPEHTEVVNRI